MDQLCIIIPVMDENGILNKDIKLTPFHKWIIENFGNKDISLFKYSISNLISPFLYFNEFKKIIVKVDEKTIQLYNNSLDHFKSKEKILSKMTFTTDNVSLDKEPFLIFVLDNL